MRLAHLATNRIIISRMVAVAGTNKNIMATVTASNVNIQAIGAEKTALIGGVMGKTYKIFCDSDIDIREHDLLRDYYTGNYYKVKAGGVTTFSYGSIEYKQIIIEKTN